MKKTLITLLALSGMASADYTGSEFNAWLSDALGTRGGNKYTLTFTISDTYDFSNSQNIFSLGTGTNAWYIRHQNGRYLGMTTAADCGSYKYYQQTANTDGYIDTDTLVSNETTGVYNGWLYDGTSADAIRGATITISSASNDTKITFTAKGATEGITIQRNVFYQPNNNSGGTRWSSFGVTDDMADAAFIKSASIYYNTDVANTQMLPEPTTATLSLLALVGLAARRRRK